MNTEFLKSVGAYNFGSAIELSGSQLNSLIRIFNQPTMAVNSTLGGRSSVSLSELEGVGSVAVKYYTRGGLNRHFVKRTYLRLRSKTRCQIEYDMLKAVRNLHVMAPEPVLWAFRGNVFYQGWLVTREIKHQHTLAELSLSNPVQAVSIVETVVAQVATLIENRIYHVDLHPGNVLVDYKERVYLLDFDKARFSTKGTPQLRDRYLQRWQRAVEKHRLPSPLWEAMAKGLKEAIS